VLPEIEAAGATLTAISPEQPEFGRDLIRRHRLGFEILRDEGLEVTRRYGLEYNLPDELTEVYADLGIHLDQTNGEPQWRLPLPARYIVATDGTIRYARVHPDYTTRPEPDETVRALAELSG